MRRTGPRLRYRRASLSASAYQQDSRPTRPAGSQRAPLPHYWPRLSALKKGSHARYLLLSPR